MLESLAVVAVVLAAFALANLVVRRVLGVPLLCHFGLHRWRKTLVGRGRDAGYVVKCRACELLEDEA